MYIQDLSAGEPLSKAAQQLTAKVKQEGSPPGLPQHPAWSEQAAHSPSQGPIPAAREQHVYGRQLPPPPPIPQHRSAASYQQQPRHGQYHHASAAPNHPGGPPSAYLHPMQAQQQYQAGGQHSPLNVQHVGGTYPMGYAAGWPNDGMHGSPHAVWANKQLHTLAELHMGAPTRVPLPFPSKGMPCKRGPISKAMQQPPGNMGIQQGHRLPDLMQAWANSSSSRAICSHTRLPQYSKQQQQKVQPVLAWAAGGQPAGCRACFITRAPQFFEEPSTCSAAATATRHMTFIAKQFLTSLSAAEANSLHVLCESLLPRL